MPGFNWIGCQVTRDDFTYDQVGDVFNKRVDANILAESSASWVAQFDNCSMGYLVCLKKGTRWVVVDQY